jgi:sodium transport system permease protein
MKSKIRIVFLKELREMLRERRTLAFLLAASLMYPAIIGLLLNQMIERNTRTEREGIEMVVIGGAKAPTLMAQLRERSVTVTEAAPMNEDAIGELLRAKKTVAVLRVTDDYIANYQAMRPARLELWFDSSTESGPQRRDVEDILQAYSSNIASARLLAHGVSPATLSPIELQRHDTGTNASRSAMVIGGIIGILFLPAFFLNLSAAVDSTAGERERRSLEVLMAQPARSWELVVGKWLAASVPSLLGVTLILCVAHAILRWLPLEEIGMSWNLGWGELMLVCLVTVPLSLLSSALYIGLAMNAKTFKEAQTTVSFVTILPVIPGFVVSFMELKTATWMYLVPMLSNQTLVKELAKTGDIGPLPFVLTFSCALLPALLVVAFASWRMKSEKYVLGV